MSLVTTVAGNVVKELEWADPFYGAPLGEVIAGKVLVSQSHWMVVIPTERLGSEQVDELLDKWQALRKSGDLGKPKRIDLVFCLKEASLEECQELSELKRSGIHVSCLTEKPEVASLSFSDSAIAAALSQGVKNFSQGQLVTDEEYRAMTAATTLPHRELQSKMAKIKPLGTYTIFALCVVMWLWATATGGTEDSLTLFRFGANYPQLTLKGEWWRLFGSMFMHIGLIHLLVNMYSLFAVGPLLEKLYGNVKYLALFALSGFGGSLASALYAEASLSAGASGALFGLFGATALLGYRYKSEFPPGFGRSLSKGMVPCIAINLFYGFSNPGIDNAAHLGGLVTGLLFAFFIIPSSLTDKKNPLLVPLMLAAAIPFLVQVYVVYRAAAVTLQDYPLATYQDPKGLASVQLPAIFKLNEENGEVFWTGPGLYLSLLAVLDEQGGSVSDGTLEDALRKNLGSDIQISTTTMDQREWLLEDGAQDGAVRRQAFAYLDSTLLRIQIFAAPENAQEAEFLRQQAMKSATL